MSGIRDAGYEYAASVVLFAVTAKASSYFCRVAGGFQGFYVLVCLVEFFFFFFKECKSNIRTYNV